MQDNHILSIPGVRSRSDALSPVGRRSGSTGSPTSASPCRSSP